MNHLKLYVPSQQSNAPTIQAIKMVLGINGLDYDVVEVDMNNQKEINDVQEKIGDTFNEQVLVYKDKVFLKGYNREQLQEFVKAILKFQE